MITNYQAYLIVLRIAIDAAIYQGKWRGLSTKL